MNNKIPYEFSTKKNKKKNRLTSKISTGSF